MGSSVSVIKLNRNQLRNLTPPESLEFTQAYATTQEWSSYSDEDHEVWKILHDRRMSDLERTGSQTYLEGAQWIGLGGSSVPDLYRVNERLAHRTGWTAMPVTGFIPSQDFFRCLALRQFPTTVTVRPMDQLDYLPEPDIFHDVFGHVPLHADPAFAEFLQTFGEVASLAKSPEQMTQMARLFWFTVEFGLIGENGETRIYGSGLISSSSDATNALSLGCVRRPFNLDHVIDQPFEIDRLQDNLFIVESFEQIVDAVAEMRGRLSGGSGARLFGLGSFMDKLKDTP